MSVTPAQSFHLDRLAENQLPALAWVFRKAGRATLSRPVTLTKRSDTCPLPYESTPVAQRPSRTPWYPLAGHRESLRRNDLVGLHSALWILAYHGGTAHPLSPTPGTVVDGKVTPVRF